jgi:hypothetical protein
VLIGIGADKNSGVKLEGSNQKVFKSLNFLRRFNQGEKLDLGRPCRRGRGRQHGHGLRPRGAARAGCEGRDGDLPAQPGRDSRPTPRNTKKPLKTA